MPNALSEYDKARLAARRAAGSVQARSATRIRAALRAYADRLTSQLAALDVTTDAERHAALTASSAIIRRAADDLDTALASAVADGRRVMFHDVLAIQQRAAVAAATAAGVPMSLLGAVRAPPLTMLGAYENLGGAAKAWRTLVRGHVAAAASEADTILRDAITQGIAPRDLSKELRAYVQGSDAFHDAGRVFTSADGRKQIAASDLKRPEYQEAARRLSFNADRIAYSELGNARKEAEVTMYAADPLVIGVRWTLSFHRGHVAIPDACDGLARSNLYGMGPGVYPVDAVPGAPHPFDRCETIPLLRDVEDIDEPKPFPRRDPSAEVDLGPLAGKVTADRADRIRSDISAHVAQYATPARREALQGVAAGSYLETTPISGSGVVGSSVPAAPATPPIAFTGTTSTAFHLEVQGAIDSIPDEVHQLLRADGYTYDFGRLLTDVRPDLAGVQPPGHPPGATWDNVEGLHDRGRRQVLTTEFRVDASHSVLSGPTEVRSNRVPGVFRHEAGHGFDFALGAKLGVGTASDAPQFLAAYQADVATLNALGPAGDPLKQQLAYYLAPGRRGRLEAMAEGFGILRGGGAGYWHEAEFRRTFPKTLQAIQDMISGL